jgi:hypothetical protein
LQERSFPCAFCKLHMCSKETCQICMMLRMTRLAVFKVMYFCHEIQS